MSLWLAEGSRVLQFIFKYYSNVSSVGCILTSTLCFQTWFGAGTYIPGFFYLPRFISLHPAPWANTDFSAACSSDFSQLPAGSNVAAAATFMLVRKLFMFCKKTFKLNEILPVQIMGRKKLKSYQMLLALMKASIRNLSSKTSSFSLQFVSLERAFISLKNYFLSTTF